MEKICCITGASRGLGSYLAHSFWKNGFSLVLSGKNFNTLQKIANNFLPSFSQHCYCCAADLSTLDGADIVLEWLSQNKIQVDILINNAAMHGPVGLLVDNDHALWRSTMQCNMLSPMRLTQGMLPAMLEAGFGRVVNISGGGASGPRPRFSAYATSKTALVRFTETLGAELMSTGVTVNAIAPGAMKTRLLGELLWQGRDVVGEKEWKIAQNVFESDGASMERVASLCLFLASSASDGITGKLISAVWDPWESLAEHKPELESDIYTLRRITPKDRGQTWGNDL